MKTKIWYFVKTFIKLYIIGIALVGGVKLGFNQYRLNQVDMVRTTGDTEALYKAVQEVKHPVYEIRVPDITTYSTVEISDTYEGTYYFGDNVIAEEGVTQADIDYFYNTFEYVPNTMKQYLINNDWTFVLTPDVIEVTETDRIEKASGLCYCSEKKIMISTNYMREQGTICHELGHALYYAGLNELLENVDKEVKGNELDKIYMHNAHGMVYLYYIEEEQLAQLFDEYCVYPESFKAQAPTLYEAFDKAVENL